MKTSMKNLNVELYSNELLEAWTNKEGLIPAETTLINKYLTDINKSVLEAGTGGGRISFHIEKIGFQKISAFDFAPNMIKRAKETATTNKSNIDFRILDASNLNQFDDNTFEYLIYLQQVLCFIDNEEQFLTSLKEAYRIAKKDGIIIFSFLDFDSRNFNSILSFILSILRSLRKEDISKQYIPWLKINNRINWKLFNKNQPVTYWVKRDQIVSILKKIGFSILEVNNANQLVDHNDKKRNGMLYIVCQK
jgi:ubiquinone/menaquinone biosynthesis C-methylase UbiE